MKLPDTLWLKTRTNKYTNPLPEAKLGETRCGRVPARGDRLETLVDLWLNISQHFDTAGEKKLPGCISRSDYQQRNIQPWVPHLRAVSKFFLSKNTDSYEMHCCYYVRNHLLLEIESSQKTSLWFQTLWTASAAKNSLSLLNLFTQYLEKGLWPF